MTESGAARPGDSQGHNLLRKHLGEILASQTSHPSIEKPCSIGGPSRRHTERVRRDLRHHRFEALPDRSRTDIDRYRAIRLEV
jgi:hypothetical protein